MITDRARELRRIIEGLAEALDDSSALQSPELFPDWDDDSEYKVGDRARYHDTLYKCLTAHTSQASWAPPASPSLWVRVDDPGIEYPEWIQPTGSTDSYQAGDKVSHNEKHWISTVNNNVWEPGVYGWEEVAGD